MIQIAMASSIVAFQHVKMPVRAPVSPIFAFGNPSIASKSLAFDHQSSTRLFFYDNEADMMENFVGGKRYEMVELPDSLVDTTVFIGNLCEFVTDEMLSALFRQASSLNFIPACVARKPNSSSLKYGFATFPTVEEKEAAIIRFTGYVLNERPIRVESIIDYKYRVRVPGKLVSYTVGEVKRTRDGTRNTLRMARNSRQMDKMRKKGGQQTLEGRGNSRSNGKRKRKERRKRRKDNNFDIRDNFC